VELNRVELNLEELNLEELNLVELNLEELNLVEPGGTRWNLGEPLCPPLQLLHPCRRDARK
jgi:hypothetical protein